MGRFRVGLLLVALFNPTAALPLAQQPEPDASELNKLLATTALLRNRNGHFAVFMHSSAFLRELESRVRPATNPRR